MDSNRENYRLAAIEAALDKFSAEWIPKMREMQEFQAKAEAQASKEMQELRKFQAKTEAQASKEMQELREFQAKAEAQAEKEYAELRASNAQTDKKLKEMLEAKAQMFKQMGGMYNSQGAATTELFYNSLKNGHRELFGEKFDLVVKEERRNSIVGFEDEYDIIMFNGQSVCIVEVKYKADSNDIPQVLKKERTFRRNFPEHQNKRLYLAVASRSFHKLTEKTCYDNGIAMIKLVGETLVVTNENIKIF